LSAKVAGVDLDLTQASAGPRATGTAAQLFYAPADGTKGLSGSDLPVFCRAFFLAARAQPCQPADHGP
jgi:hypothetical protein